MEDNAGTGPMATSPALAAYLRKLSREASDEGASIALVPTLSYGFDQFSVRFSVQGPRGAYVVRSLSDFVDHLRALDEVSYGPKLSFVHRLSAFVPASRPLVGFVERAVRLRRERAASSRAMCGRFGGAPAAIRGRERGASECGRVGRTLALSEDEAVAFLDAVGEVPFAFECTDGSVRSRMTVHCAAGDPPAVLRLVEEAEGVALMRDDALIGAFSGDRAYVLFDDVFYRCTDGFAEGAEFLREVYNADDPALFVDRADLPQFAAVVLPRLEEAFEVQAPASLSAYRRRPCRLAFYFDCLDDAIQVGARACYGTDEVVLALAPADVPGAVARAGEGAVVMAGILDEPPGPVPAVPVRDEARERAALDVLRAYLPPTGVLSLDDEHHVGQLLFEGLARFQEMGEVHTTAAFDRLLFARPPRLSLGLSLAGNLIAMDVSVDDVSADELAALLSFYRRHRRFHRLRSGAFIDMNASDVAELARLGADLGIEDGQWAAGTVELPTYQAFYLDNELKDAYREQGFVQFVERYRSLYRRAVRGMEEPGPGPEPTVPPGSDRGSGPAAEPEGRSGAGTASGPASDAGARAVGKPDLELGPAAEPEGRSGARPGDRAQEAPFGMLRSYQRAGVRWMEALLEADLGGILADEMGLGKTLQVIAVLAARADRDPSHPSLVVCPASLVYNWAAEFARFAPRLSVVVVAGDAASRRAARREPCAVFVTSYDLVRQDAAEWEERELDVLVLDEAHYIKNHATRTTRAVKRLRSRHRLALTGTPLENRLSELWSLFDFLMPGLLGPYQRFRERFEAAIIGGDEEAARRLRLLTAPFILRRTKAAVAPELPAKTTVEVPVVLEGEQRRLYRAAEQSLRERLAAQIRLSRSRAAKSMDARQREALAPRVQVLAELTSLRRIALDPALVFENYEGGSAKLEALMDLVEAAVASGQKMLVYSQFTSFLARVAERLANAGVSFFQLTGATPKKERLALASAFNENEVPVFLVSLKAGGVGLNLTGATLVVHADPWWNDAAARQAADRTHRIGQRRPVTVYELVAQDTIEERMRTLARMKADLAALVLGEDEGGEGSADALAAAEALSPEELYDLLG